MKPEESLQKNVARCRFSETFNTVKHTQNTCKDAREQQPRGKLIHRIINGVWDVGNRWSVNLHISKGFSNISEGLRFSHRRQQISSKKSNNYTPPLTGRSVWSEKLISYVMNKLQQAPPLNVHTPTHAHPMADPDKIMFDGLRNRLFFFL